MTEMNITVVETVFNEASGFFYGISSGLRLFNVPSSSVEKKIR